MPLVTLLPLPIPLAASWSSCALLAVRGKVFWRTEPTSEPEPGQLGGRRLQAYFSGEVWKGVCVAITKLNSWMQDRDEAQYQLIKIRYSSEWKSCRFFVHTREDKGVGV